MPQAIVIKGKFEGGQLVLTQGIAAEVAEGNLNPVHYLARHFNGDWGDLCADDKAENEFSLKHGYRLLSSYEKTPVGKIWIITEADRSATTILFPSEY